MSSWRFNLSILDLTFGGRAILKKDLVYFSKFSALVMDDLMCVLKDSSS